MIDYIIDHMEKNGVCFESHDELARVTEGIRMYLAENGISENDTGSYFKQYLDRVLRRVDRQDLKAYFLYFPVISRVNQICIEFCADGSVAEARKADLRNDMAKLYTAGLGDKYVPAAEVKGILGKMA